MNIDTNIKKWLLACGKPDGTRIARAYRFSDPTTRQKEQYFEYRDLGCVPVESGSSDISTKTNYTAHVTHTKAHETTIEVVLYNSQDGTRELSSYCIAAQRNEAIKSVFTGCKFKENLGVTNDTTYDADEIYYKHTLRCVFKENITFTRDEEKAIVDSVEFNLLFDGE